MLSPATVQAVAGEQGAQAAVPLANVPLGQVVAVKAQVEAPWELKDPTAQGWQAARELAPRVAEKVPAAQGVQVARVEAPVGLLKVPAGQGWAVMEESGQNEPAGHSTGAPLEQK